MQTGTGYAMILASFLIAFSPLTLTASPGNDAHAYLTQANIEAETFATTQFNKDVALEMQRDKFNQFLSAADLNIAAIEKGSAAQRALIDERNALVIAKSNLWQISYQMNDEYFPLIPFSRCLDLLHVFDAPQYSSAAILTDLAEWTYSKRDRLDEISYAQLTRMPLYFGTTPLENANGEVYGASPIQTATLVVRGLETTLASLRTRIKALESSYPLSAAALGVLYDKAIRRIRQSHIVDTNHRVEFALGVSIDTTLRPTVDMSSLGRLYSDE